MFDKKKVLAVLLGIGLLVSVGLLSAGQVIQESSTTSDEGVVYISFDEVHPQISHNTTAIYEWEIRTYEYSNCSTLIDSWTFSSDPGGITKTTQPGVDCITHHLAVQYDSAKAGSCSEAEDETKAILSGSGTLSGNSVSDQWEYTDGDWSVCFDTASGPTSDWDISVTDAHPLTYTMQEGDYLDWEFEYQIYS